MRVKYYYTLLLILFTLFSTYGQKINKNIDTLVSTQEIPTVLQSNYAGYYNSFYFENKDPSFNKPHIDHTGDATKVLQSNISGLIVSNNAYSPGASHRILLRGYRSLIGKNQPLILLNGIPIDNSEWRNTIGGTDQSNRLSDIDPNSIESIEIIKSMIGRAKYGIVGANGIISIKTKRGYDREPKISFKSSVGIDHITNKPLLQNIYAQGKFTSRGSEYRGPDMFTSASWGPEISTLFYDDDSSYPYDKNGKLSTISSNKPAKAYDTYDFFKNGFFTNHTLQITGGSHLIGYHITASTNNQTGIIPTTYYNRYNLSSALNFNITPKLSLQLDAFLSRSDAQRNRKGAELGSIMLDVLRTPPTFDNTNAVEDPVNDQSAYQFSDGSQRNYFLHYNNPYWSLNKNKHNDEVNRQIIRLSSTYNVIKSMDVFFNIGLDRYSDKRQGGNDINIRKYPSHAFTLKGNAYNRAIDYQAQSADVSTQYRIIEKPDVKLATTVGLNYNQRKTTYTIQEGKDLRNSDDLSIKNARTVESTSSTDDNKRMGAIVTVDLNYKNFLDITGSLRQDYSNKFGSKVNGFLSYGAGMSISLIHLFSPSSRKKVDLKLLASIGRFGNEYSTNSRYSTYRKAILDGDDFLNDIKLEDFVLNSTKRSDFLSAETVNAYDIGLTFSLVKSKLRLSLLYYNESSEDLFLITPIASSSGYTHIEQNAGSINNKGFDISISGTPIHSDVLSWSFNIGFNKNQNTVTSVGDNSFIFLNGFQNRTNLIAIEDQPYGVISGFGFLRNDEGKIIIGNSGFPIANFERKVFGDPNPDWTMYLSNTFTIVKQISLQATLDIKQGGDVYCGTCGSLDYLGRSQRSANDRGVSKVFDGVRSDGSKNTQSVELVSSSSIYRSRYGIHGLTEMNVYNATWVRLRHLSLSYDFSNIIVSNFIQQISISAYAENVFISTPYPGMDPETNLTGNNGASGFDYYNNPGTRRYGMTLKATF